MVNWKFGTQRTPLATIVLSPITGLRFDGEQKQGLRQMAPPLPKTLLPLPDFVAAFIVAL